MRVALVTGGTRGIGRATAQAAANTKRAAEQVAARALLARLEGLDD